MLFLLVRHRALLPRLMCYYSCACRCSADDLVLLLIRCYYCVVLLLLLLCLRYVFAANPRENGYYGRLTLSGMCLRILKLKDGSICFGACARTVSCQLCFRMIRTCTLCCRCCLLLLNLVRQRNLRRFALSIRSIDCCSTNCFVVICRYSIQYGHRASRTSRLF